MKKGFTIVEVSILFVIFIIVAFLVAPMSLDDTMQAKNTSRWRTVQSDFVNIFFHIRFKVGIHILIKSTHSIVIVTLQPKRKMNYSEKL